MSLTRQIILIEDDEAIREGLKDFLESEGHSVLAAENGKKGLELLRSSNKPLLLLDLQMPVMSGEQLLATLKTEEFRPYKEVPILVLTARGEPFHHDGIAGIIRKPVDLDELLLKVSHYCAV